MITGTSPFIQDIAVVGVPVLTLAAILFRGWCRRKRPTTLAELYDDDKGEALTRFHQSPRP